MSLAPWQRTQWASKIAFTSLVYVGFAGTSGLHPSVRPANVSANNPTSSTFDMLITVEGWWSTSG